MRKAGLAGRKGKQADGSSKTREVKLGAAFTQHGVDAEGRPLRDHGSTTYVASHAPSGEFSLLLRAAARRRGVGSTKQVIFLSDGGPGGGHRSGVLCRMRRHPGLLPRQ